METITLRERCPDWNHALSVESGQRLVKNVALSGTASRNGYSYTEEALRGAVDLYRDKPVFLDHGPDRNRPQERSTRDLVGSVVNPRFVAGRLRGDIRVLETESGQTFLTLVDSQTPGVGMSHVVLARRSHDGRSIEQITDVISIDAVINPATTTTFRESAGDPGDPGDPGAEPLQEVADQLRSELTEARDERDQLLQQLADLRAAFDRSRTETAIHTLIRESQLPQSAVSSSFLEQLRSVASDDQRRALVQDRAALLSLRPQAARLPHSHPRTAPPAGTAGDAEFISAVRRR